MLRNIKEKKQAEITPAYPVSPTRSTGSAKRRACSINSAILLMLYVQTIPSNPLSLADVIWQSSGRVNGGAAGRRQSLATLDEFTAEIENMANGSTLCRNTDSSTDMISLSSALCRTLPVSNR